MALEGQHLFRFFHREAGRSHPPNDEWQKARCYDSFGSSSASKWRNFGKLPPYTKPCYTPVINHGRRGDSRIIEKWIRIDLSSLFISYPRVNCRKLAELPIATRWIEYGSVSEYVANCTHQVANTFWGLCTSEAWYSGTCSTSIYYSCLELNIKYRVTLVSAADMVSILRRVTQHYLHPFAGCHHLWLAIFKKHQKTSKNIKQENPYCHCCLLVVTKPGQPSTRPWGSGLNPRISAL